MTPSMRKSGNYKAGMRPQRMADDLPTRLRYAQKGRVLRGAMKTLGLTISEIAREIEVSQGHLSKVLDTYCDLEITTCEMYLGKVAAALARRGVRITESDEQIMLMYERSGFEIDLKIPTD